MTLTDDKRQQMTDLLIKKIISTSLYDEKNMAEKPEWRRLKTMANIMFSCKKKIVMSVLFFSKQSTQLNNINQKHSYVRQTIK